MYKINWITSDAHGWSAYIRNTVTLNSSNYDRSEIYWTDINGNLHRVSEMTTNHIINCIAFLEPRVSIRKRLDLEEMLIGGELSAKDWIWMFEKELKFRKTV